MPPFPVARMVLIQDDSDAQRLIVTWPQVASIQDDQARLERWEAVSGVDRIDIEKREPMLFTNGFLGPDGLVDPRVLDFIAILISSKIAAERKRTQSGRK